MDYLTIILTKNCNFKCKHCFVKRNKKEMDIDTFQKILYFFKKKKIIVELTGGEILTHSKIVNIWDKLAKRNIKFSFITNGWLLSNYHREILRYKKYINGIGISMESLKEDLHDKIRKKGSFKKIKKEIQFLKKNKIPLMILFTINKLNYSELSKVYIFTKKNNIKIKFNRIIPSKSNKQLCFNKKHKKELDKTMNKLLFDNKEFKISFNLLDKNIMSLSNLDFCLNVNNNIHVIDTSGNLRLCCDLIDMTNKKFDYFGNIKKTTYKRYMLEKNKKIKKLIYRWKNEKNNVNVCDWCLKINHN